jgi:signal transduction histidine kinase
MEHFAMLQGVAMSSRWMTPPAFPSFEETARARMFHGVVWTVMASATFLLMLTMIVQPEHWRRAILTTAVVDGLGLLLLFLSHKLSIRAVSTMLVGGLILVIAFNALSAGGIRSPGVISYSVLVMMAGLLMGYRAGIVTAVVCALLALALVATELTGHLPEQTVFNGPLTRWAMLCIYMGVGLTLMRLATRTLTQALHRTEAELQLRKQAEEQRIALESQLRQSHKMEALGTLAGGIAHDFNNILTALQGNLALAQEDIPADHPAADSLEEIHRAAVRARALITRILIFSRRQVAQRAPLDIAPIVDEALQLLKSALPANVRLQTRYAEALPRVLADGTQILQIALNLGTNASHAMREQGGTLTVELAAVRFDGRSGLPAAELSPGAYVRLTFQDSGAGIAPETLERIFEPFFTTKGAEGTGLGLSVVYGIVREHGGAIAVDSAPGRDTSFHVYLPVSEA